jgi:hypothetical protein
MRSHVNRVFNVAALVFRVGREGGKERGAGAGGGEGRGGLNMFMYECSYGREMIYHRIIRHITNCRV